MWQRCLPGENLDVIVGKVQLHPVAVEFDLVNPSRAARHFLDRGRQRGLNEIGERRLDADRRRRLIGISWQSASVRYVA